MSFMFFSVILCHYTSSSIVWHEGARLIQYHSAWSCIRNQIGTEISAKWTLKWSGGWHEWKHSHNTSVACGPLSYDQFDQPPGINSAWLTINKNITRTYSSTQYCTILYCSNLHYTILHYLTHEHDCGHMHTQSSEVKSGQVKLVRDTHCTIQHNTQYGVVAHHLPTLASTSTGLPSSSRTMISDITYHNSMAWSDEWIDGAGWDGVFVVSGISYHIISYHIISYHIISYHITASMNE